MQRDLSNFWNDIPIGKQNAADYYSLCQRWGMKERTARRVLHELSLYDNGDNYVLIRSSKNRGFYKTDDTQEIKDFRQECMNRGRNIFATIRKCNRVLRANDMQMSLTNNLLVMRKTADMKQSEVCRRLAEMGYTVDAAMLSKFENNWALPLPEVTAALAKIYGCTTEELICYAVDNAV